MAALELRVIRILLACGVVSLVGCSVSTGGGGGGGKPMPDDASAEGAARTAEAGAPGAAALGDAGACSSAPYGGSCQAVAQASAPAMFSHMAPGVAALQVTTSGSNFNTYYDVPAFVSCGRIAIDDLAKERHLSFGPAEGGSFIQVASYYGKSQGVYMTPDGALAYYVGSNEDGTLDIYDVDASTPDCAASRLTHLSLAPALDDGGAGAGPAKLSTASRDPESGSWVFAISTGPAVHRVKSDGSALPDIALTDPESLDPFHSIRLNPVCPNILMYRHAKDGSTGLPELWLVDLDAPSSTRMVSPTANSHQLWSPDGRKLGYTLSGKDGVDSFVVADAVGDDCTLAASPDGGLVETNLVPSGGASAGFCAWAPDQSRLVCNSNCVGTDQVFLMDLDGGTTFVTDTDRRCGQSASLYGQANAQFMPGNKQIALTTDATGEPQVYIVTLPPGL